MLRGLCLVLGTETDADKRDWSFDRDAEVKTEKKEQAPHGATVQNDPKV